MEGEWGAVGEMCVVPSPDSPYADLGGVDPVNLISFAYQIASGMVSILAKIKGVTGQLTTVNGKQRGKSLSLKLA